MFKDNKIDLPFYKQYGFEITGEGTFDVTGDETFKMAMPASKQSCGRHPKSVPSKLGLCLLETFTLLGRAAAKSVLLTYTPPKMQREAPTITSMGCNAALEHRLNDRSGPFASIDTMGGDRTFAARGIDVRLSKFPEPL
ncbi:hypothetical protein [Sulfitobacter sp. SH24]|uniref:hypothetical protein n=1 Tax=Sulfitobacter sp. SH24 TaxID=3421173 RepID=UPI003F50AAE6